MPLRTRRLRNTPTRECRKTRRRQDARKCTSCSKTCQPNLFRKSTKGLRRSKARKMCFRTSRPQFKRYNTMSNEVPRTRHHLIYLLRPRRRQYFTFVTRTGKECKPVLKGQSYARLQLRRTTGHVNGLYRPNGLPSNAYHLITRRRLHLHYLLLLPRNAGMVGR